MAIIGWPPRLAVGHQRVKVTLYRRIIEQIEFLRIVKVFAKRIGRLRKDSSDSRLGHQSRTVRPSGERKAARSLIGS